MFHNLCFKHTLIYEFTYIISYILDNLNLGNALWGKNSHNPLGGFADRFAGLSLRFSLMEILNKYILREAQMGSTIALVRINGDFA